MAGTRLGSAVEQRQFHSKPRSFADTWGGYSEGAAVLLHDALGDEQP
eukprot:CAMPEP_0184967808 /NCGR_PEP_ID=MMETSP1098-20130426/1054_1 /TAXON_ID=89044 /ORGANISM="Spumella elongata, Strain CCAP 955/1" /LENGTH=46 /DNA_ID= /DNA_START= /DNA_END= /DNA_ORIENTATION=